jgi:hypothetical protein
MIGVVRFKAGVRITGCPSPAQARIIGELDTIARARSFDLLVTCGEEAHGPSDPHTLRLALDVRAEDFEPDDAIDVAARLRDGLGSRWTVLYESPTLPANPALASIAYVNPDATAPHFHVQPVKGTTYPPVPPQP